MDDPLRGARLRLSVLREADLAAMLPWFEDGAFLRLLDADLALPPAEARWRHRLRSPDARFLAARALDDDRLVGYVGLTGILWHQGVAWLEMAVAPHEQGRGYGGEALRLALAFAFREANLRRLQLTVFAYNTRAMGLYERAGFRREGTYREFVHRDGRCYDMILYGMLRREWQG